MEIQIPVLPRRQRATQEAQPAQRHVLHAPRHLVDQHRLEALSVEALVLPEHSAQVSKAITFFMLTTLHTYPPPPLSLPFSCRLQETTITTLPNGGGLNGGAPTPITAVSHNESASYEFAPLGDYGQLKDPQLSHQQRMQESRLN